MRFQKNFFSNHMTVKIEKQNASLQLELYELHTFVLST